ncbi:glycosyltransferase [Roseospira navarrensis]|uniref:Glycosyltransferase n=1 Tax=Roseospira navarrensis TaxID=140058 RepID=A0A7X1ZH59_9PROT|nr:glycosyltransferase [Roseospira navarrensis]MQX38426.1 glycosyltransferase [Roseospira navarrensis]
MSGDTGRTRLLHISADFPDPLRPAKTRAIANLLALTDDVVQHTVYSINRVSHTLPLAALVFGPDWRAVAYPGPPRGLFLKTYLDRLGDWILRDVRTRGLSVDAVHAHKLSTDALAAARVADGLGVPLLISSQGNSDLKIIGKRPDLRPVWRGLWRRAAVVFPFAPWTAEGLTAMLGPREGSVVTLPCPTGQDSVMTPRPTEPVIKTVFNLHDYENKNAVGLIQAVAAAARTVPDIRLEILGGGDPTGYAVLQGAIQRHAPDRCRLRGPVPHEAVQAEMNAACAVAMVSRRESYGMVYAEALLAGAPVIHAATNGIAGYFPASPAVVGVDPGDPDALVAALVAAVQRQAEAKAALATLQASGALDQLTDRAIRETYATALRTCL